MAMAALTRRRQFTLNLPVGLVGQLAGETMSTFTTPLQIEENGDGTFSLLASFEYYLVAPPGERVVVHKGYRTDFASTKPFHWLFPPYHPDYGKAAVVHDYLCTHSHIQKPDGTERECSRAEADKIFREAQAVLGSPFWKRWTMWSAVRLYAIVTRK